MPSQRMLPAVLLLFSAVAACGAFAGDRSMPAHSNNASTMLIESASQQYAAGHLDQAAATLERALQIQPNNPATLHYLGVLRLQQGQYQQAETLAVRSNMRVGSNNALRNRNFQLIQAARNGQVYGALPAADQPPASAQAVNLTPTDPFTPPPQPAALQRLSNPVTQAEDMDIPQGHRPPPGKCRIWFPGVPPGHQPAPVKCKKLKGRIPQGAYLIRH